MKNRIARLTSGSFVISTVIVSSIISTGQVDAQDNPVVKNGNPCIEEICINDEIKNLPQLNWEKVNIRPTDPGLSLKASGDPGAIKVFSKYLNARSIDGIGLRALGKIKGFCESPLGGGIGDKMIFPGTYLNRKGQSVQVNFDFVPSNDGKSQKFIVTNIFKMIQKEKVTEVQYENLATQAKARYQGYYYDYRKSARYPNVSIINNSMRGVTLHIKSQFGQVPDGVAIDPSKFQYFPGCGGDRKIKL